ncbi:MAG: hypothetical protein LKG35_09190, partial [Olsenella sp.]|nr:hypothetical protein [Olsenella sp.]
RIAYIVLRFDQARIRAFASTILSVHFLSLILNSPFSDSPSLSETVLKSLYSAESQVLFRGNCKTAARVVNNFA